MSMYPNYTESATGQLRADISDAVLNGYILNLEINSDWVSYRHPEHPWNSASLAEGRLNRGGQTAFYLASGDYCGTIEVPNYFERVRCNIAPHTVQVFDLARFSLDYGYTDAFVQQRKSRGWAVCQQVSNYLTSHHAVSGILYQSAALRQRDEFGYCMAIIPGREASLPNDFFISPQSLV